MEGNDGRKQFIIHTTCKFPPCKGDIRNNLVKLFHPLILFIIREHGNRIFIPYPTQRNDIAIIEGCDGKKCHYHMPSLFLTDKNKQK